MSNTNDSTTLTGHDAIAYAEKHDLPLCMYNSPIQDARDDLTVDEARTIAAEDPSLIYVTAEATGNAMTASRFADKSATEVLAALCPGGEPVDGVEVDQDWDNECTVITFADGTALRVSDTVDVVVD